MKCITCNKEFGGERNTAKFCSVSCKLAYHRNRVSVSKEEKSDTLNDTLKTEEWIPNWKRVGFKTREDSFVELTKIIGQLGGRWYFQGFKFDLPIGKSNK